MLVWNGTKDITNANDRYLVVWIPGFNDTFYHKHIIDNGIFQKCDILLMHFNDYTPYFAKDNEKPYNCEDFFQHFPEIDRLIKKQIIKQTYDKFIMYGHGIGGLIASVYCAQGTYKKLFDCIILNEPFIESNLQWYIDKSLSLIQLHPFVQKYDNFAFRFDRNAIINNCGDKISRKTIIKYDSAGYNVDKKIQKHLPYLAGFVVACSRFNNIINNNKNKLFYIPLLVLVCDNSDIIIKSNAYKQYIEKLTSNNTMYVCSSCHYDALCPINKHTNQADYTELEKTKEEINKFILALTPITKNYSVEQIHGNATNFNWVLIPTITITITSIMYIRSFIGTKIF